MNQLGPFAVSGYYVGDCRKLLRQLPDRCINCCVTSPPYWGLRSYLPDNDSAKPFEIGHEATPEEYVAHVVAVFREVKRVLRDDGTLWLNLGDCYATGASGSHTEANSGKATPRLAAMGPMTQPNRMPIPGLKPKDLVGIPWRMAFALQADGWYLRSDIIWAKPNPMPESVLDRPTRSHEYLFLLAKSESYYYDAASIVEPAAGANKHDLTGPGYAAPGQTEQTGNRGKNEECPDRRRAGFNARWDRREAEEPITTRNRRSVWMISPKPTAEAHFATFPCALVQPCILAGCPAGGVLLDPFGGSGTTGRVAEDNGRKWLLFDLSPKYAEIAKRKTAQVGLFNFEEPKP